MVHPRADQPVIERRGQAAQIGVLRQRLDDRLGFTELLGVVTTSWVGRNSSPFFWKKGPPPASMIEWNRSFCSDSFAISAAVACDASSEVGRR